MQHTEAGKGQLSLIHQNAAGDVRASSRTISVTHQQLVDIQGETHIHETTDAGISMVSVGYHDYYGNVTLICGINDQHFLISRRAALRKAA